MRFRSLAAVVLLLLVAAAGFVVVRELTRPAPAEPIAPITIDPDRGVQAGEAGEDDEGRASSGASATRDREGGFAPPSAATPEPGARGRARHAAAPDRGPPAAPGGDTDDDGGDD